MAPPFIPTDGVPPSEPIQGCKPRRILDGASLARAGLDMPSEEPQAKRKLPLVKLGIVAAVMIVGAVLVLRGLDYKALGEQGLRVIRGAGPWAFFAALAVLPAFGAPLSAFTIMAGEVFAPLMPSEEKLLDPKSANVDCDPFTVGASSIHSAVCAKTE